MSELTQTRCVRDVMSHSLLRVSHHKHCVMNRAVNSTDESIFARTRVHSKYLHFRHIISIKVVVFA